MALVPVIIWIYRTGASKNTLLFTIMQSEFGILRLDLVRREMEIAQPRLVRDLQDLFLLEHEIVKHFLAIVVMLHHGLLEDVLLGARDVGQEVLPLSGDRISQAKFVAKIEHACLVQETLVQ